MEGQWAGVEGKGLATGRQLLELADRSLGGDYTIIVGFVFWFF